MIDRSEHAFSRALTARSVKRQQRYLDGVIVAQ